MVLGDRLLKKNTWNTCEGDQVNVKKNKLLAIISNYCLKQIKSFTLRQACASYYVQLLPSNIITSSQNHIHRFYPHYL